jgi:hypothetical protein
LILSIYFGLHFLGGLGIYIVHPQLLDFSDTNSLVQWVLIGMSALLYVILVFSAPGYVEANLIKVENFESYHHDSLPRVTNFSQKMSSNSKPTEVDKQKKSPIVRNISKKGRMVSQNLQNQGYLSKNAKDPIVGKKLKKKKKYLELEEDFERISDLSKPKSDIEDERNSHSQTSAGNEQNLLRRKFHNKNARRSMLEGKEGLTKVIKSVNTQQMTEYFETNNNTQRKKVFETINERIQNSRITFETENENSDLNNLEFLQKIDQDGVPELIQAKKTKHKKNSMVNIDLEDYRLEKENPDEIIGSSMLYGTKIPPKKRRNVSIMDGNDQENKNTEKEHHDIPTEKMYDFDTPGKEGRKQRDTYQQYHFNVENLNEDGETENKGNVDESVEYKDNSTTQYPPDRAAYNMEHHHHM